MEFAEMGKYEVQRHVTIQELLMGMDVHQPARLNLDGAVQENLLHALLYAEMELLLRLKHVMMI